MSQALDNKLVEINGWYQNHRKSATDINMKVKFLQDAMNFQMEAFDLVSKDFNAYEKGSASSGLIWQPQMKVSRDRKQNNENFDLWYGCHRYRTKSLEEYVEFLLLLMDEQLAQLAHICRSMRELEGRR